MSRFISYFAQMVRLFPLTATEMHKNHRQMEAIRTICTCQHHARRERTMWRRSLRLAQRATRRLGRGGVALIIGVPLAFGALGIPSEAMNLEIPSLAQVMPSPDDTVFPIFTTPRVRRDFLTPDATPRRLTLEIAKETFFRSHVPYGSIIYRESVRNNLPPELVAAVVSAESDFRVSLVSQKNAQGLMQIIPSTGRLMGAEDLFDPSENIAAGTKYLRYLFDRFGNERVVLAAYNAGEGNVERFGGIPPFPETIDYVHRVSERTHLYRQRIRGNFVTSMRMQASE